MKRIKVINDPSDLVPMLMALDTQVKRDVFNDVARDWCTVKQVEQKYGKDGKAALQFFEKMKLVETMWQTTEANKQEKSYHTYYMSFHINTSAPVNEIVDVLSVAVMSDKEYEKIETKIFELTTDQGEFAGNVIEKLKFSNTMLKSLVRRSDRLELRGHRIERIKEIA